MSRIFSKPRLPKPLLGPGLGPGLGSSLGFGVPWSNPIRPPSLALNCSGTANNSGVSCENNA